MRQPSVPEEAASAAASAALRPAAPLPTTTMVVSASTIGLSEHAPSFPVPALLARAPILCLNAVLPGYEGKCPSVPLGEWRTLVHASGERVGRHRSSTGLRWRQCRACGVPD